jgi:hypothetical protein
MARRQLIESSPDSVAFAAHEFIIWPLRDNLHRGGKRLRPSMTARRTARRGTGRVIYRISSEGQTFGVLAIVPGGDAYRSPRPDLAGGSAIRWSKLASQRRQGRRPRSSSSGWSIHG